MQNKKYSFQQTALKSLLTSFLFCCCLALTNNTMAQMFEKAYQSQENHSGYSVVEAQSSVGGYIMAGTAFAAGVPEPAPSWINVVAVDANGATMWNKQYDLGASSARCFNINHTPDGYILSGMVDFGGISQACLIHIDFNGAVIDSRIYYDNILGANSQALHTVFSYQDFSFTTVGFVNDDNYDNTGNKQAFVFRSDYGLNIMCDQFFDTPQMAGTASTDYDMAEHVTELHGSGFFITGSMNAPLNYNKQGVLALRIDNNCNLVANGSFSSSNSTEAGVSAVFDGQRIHLLSNNSEIHNFELTTFGPNLNIMNHVGFSPCCDNYAGFSLRESPTNPNNLVIAGHVRSYNFVDDTGTMSFDNSPPFLLEVEKVSGNPVSAGVFGTYYQVVNNFNGMVSYRNYGGFYQPFTGQQPFIFSPEMLTTTLNGEYALVSHRTNFSNELDIELIKTDMFGKATDCQEEIIFSPFQLNPTPYNNIDTNFGLVATFPAINEIDLLPNEIPVCGDAIYPCDDPAVYGAVGLNLIDLGSNVGEADIVLPAGASLVNWTIDFGDGSPANTYATHPVTHTYASAGSYTVCAWGSYMINNVECFFQLCDEIVIETTPCDPTAVSLTLTDLGGGTIDIMPVLPAGANIVNWDVNTGDGNTTFGLTTANYLYTYATGGLYNVCAWGVYIDAAGMTCDFQVCNEIEITDPCDPSLVSLNLTDLGGNVAEADITLPAGASLLSWTIDFGDGSPANTYATHPITHTYAMSGGYGVCAWGSYVINNVECFFQLCDEIVLVDTDPCDDISFTYTSNPTAPYTFDFVANYVGGLTVVSVDWIFGDGNTGTGNPITHTYATSGSYVVCAIFTFVDAAGNTYVCEWCEEIVITHICDPSAVSLNLTDLGGGVVEADLGLPAGASVGSWTIDFGDGNPPSTYFTSPVTYTYAASGGYGVCAWGYYIINNMECDFQTCSDIGIEITEPYEPCPNNLVINGDFENGDDGSFTTGTLPFDPNCQIQSYAVVNNATDKCGNVSVFDHTNPPFGLFLDIDGYSSAAGDVWCQNVSVTSFTNYTFSFWATDFNLTDMNPNINMTINGTVVNAVSVNTDVWTQYVATWNSGATSGAITLCLNQTNFIGIGVDYGIDDIEFCATSQNDPCADANIGISLFPNGLELGVSPFFDTSVVAAWEIDFGDGYTTGVNTGLPYSAVHTYNANGIYLVCLYVWIIDPATGEEIFCEICEEIYIEGTDPCFGFNVELQGSIVSCDVDNGILEATVVGGTAPYTYTWINNQTNQTSVGGPQIGNLAAGSYTVVVTDANGCETTATIILVQEDCECVAIAPTGLTTTINWPQVTLAWNPVPNVAQYQLAGRKLGGAVKVFPPQTATFRTFNGGISPNSTYQWAVRSICPDGSVSDWSVIETFTTPNAKNALQSMTDPFETNEAALTAKAYPNPAINNITIEYTLGENTWNSNENINITISDLLGRAVISQTVAYSESNQLNLDVSQLPTGTYVLQIDNGFDKYTEKLSVTH